MRFSPHGPITWAALVFSAAALPAPAIGQEAEQSRLQGKWRIMAVELQGEAVARKEMKDEWKELFANDVVIRDDRWTQAKAAVAGKFRLDGGREPKQITFLDDDGKPTFRGIYALKGEELTVCMNGDGTDVRRPEEFVTKRGTSLVLLKLRRTAERK